MSEQYITIPAYIRTHFLHLTHTDKWFYVCLHNICGEQRSCAMSLRSLSTETGIGIAKLSESITTLHASGLIKAEKKRRTTGGNEVWHISLLELSAGQLSQLPQITDKPKRIKPATPGKPDPEMKRYEAQIIRAQEANLPATLLFGEWIATLNHFNFQCAYCGGPYEIIEHFVPMALGGGTTKGNCVPACTGCNNRKNSYHPLLMPASTGMVEAIKTVYEYLKICRAEVEL